MATYYVDYAGSAGTGDGSSFANRADKIQSIFSSQTTLNSGDAIRIKGAPVTSLGTASIADTSRVHQRTGYTESVTHNKVVYSTTTGETKIQMGAYGAYGWETGDRIFIVTDPGASSLNQPSLLGVHEITVVGTDYTNTLEIKLNGYTANSNGTSTVNSAMQYMGFNQAIKLNTTGLFVNIASMDADRSAWTSATNGSTTLQAYNATSGNSSTVQTARWPTGSDRITALSGAASGGSAEKIAHYQLPSTLNLTGYRQVSFLVHCNSYQSKRTETPDTLRLCSDTAGNTTVHTIPIDLNGFTDGPNSGWTPVTVDLGVDLGQNINSIALYREEQQSSTTYYFQNIVACKNSSDANAITHSSCIGLKEANNPIWQPVDMLWNDWVIPSGGGNFKYHQYSRYSNAAGYWSSTGSAVNVFKVEPIRIDTRSLSNNTTAYDLINLTGSASSGSIAEADLVASDLSAISGGWNNTDMSSKSADFATIIHFDESNKPFHQLSNSASHLSFEDIGYHFCKEPIKTSSGSGTKNNRYKNIGTFGGTFSGFNSQSLGFDLSYTLGLTADINTMYICQHKNAPASAFNYHLVMLSYQYDDFRQYDTSGSNIRAGMAWGTIRFAGLPDRSLTWGNYTDSPRSFENLIFHGGILDARYNLMSGVNTYTNVTATNSHYPSFNGTSTIEQINITKPIRGSNTQASPYIFGRVQNPIALRHNSASTTFVNGGTMSGIIYNYSTNTPIFFDTVTRTGVTTNDSFSNNDSVSKFRNLNGTSGNHRTQYDWAIIIPNTTTRHTASGSSLEYLLDSNINNSSYLKPLTIGKIAVNANSQVTVSIWVLTDTTNEHAFLIVKSEPYMGITSDQTVEYDGQSGANTWAQITKTFTPTEAGFLEVQVAATGSSGDSVYFDDFEVTQV